MSTAAVSLPRALPRLRCLSIRPELAGLLVLAGVLNLWALDVNGSANEYYSAAVRSMASSRHDFLYGSFDQAGVMTVDKPPLAGGAAMVAVGGAWPLLVALTPAADRPWISGTADNSIWSLIFGYNGLGRLAGQSGGRGANRMGGNGGPFGGSTGVFRLVNESMGGQAGWFLGFALVAGAAILMATRLRRADARTGWLIAVGGAFLTTAVAFSYAQGIFHPYYVSLLAPFTAALVGAGFAQLSVGGMSARVLAPLAVVAGVLAEDKVLRDNSASLTGCGAG